MKYIALLYGEPDAGPAQGSPEFMQMLGEFQSATAAMAEAGVLLDSGGEKVLKARHGHLIPPLVQP